MEKLVKRKRRRTRGQVGEERQREEEGEWEGRENSRLRVGRPWEKGNRKGHVKRGVMRRTEI